MRALIPVAIGALLLAGCGGPLTEREKGAVAGGAIGAGTGAIIGSASGHAGTGAAIGGAVGAVTGAVIGGAIQGQQEKTAAAQPPPPGATSSAPPPAPQTQASVQVPGQYSGDPTRGELVNATRWRVQVFIDQDPAQQGSPQVLLEPQQTAPANLDIGKHRIVAQAYVDTQFGPRLVGKLDRPITIDPRSTGWSLRFTDSDFR